MTTMLPLGKFKDCVCELHVYKPPRRLTELILKCWQREYDIRPYLRLIINRQFFEKRLNRKFNARDLTCVIRYLDRGYVRFVEFSYITFPIKDAVLLDKLASSLNTLNEVNLIHVNLPEEFFKAFMSQPDTSVIQTLRLTNSELTEKNICALRCFVGRSRVLEVLNIRSCGITQSTFALAADGISKSKSIKAIDMSDLDICCPVDLFDDTKLPIIISILVWKNNLTEVHFRQCHLDSFGMEPIAEYLVNKSSVLKYLDLGENRIGPDGVHTLLKAIVQSRTMLGLDLSYNQIGSIGCETLAHLLPSTILQYLNISNNGIKEPSMHLLIATIKKTNQIRTLNLAGNQFNKNTAKMLHRQLSATVLCIDRMDVVVWFDIVKDEFSVVPKVQYPSVCGTLA